MQPKNKKIFNYVEKVIFSNLLLSLGAGIVALLTILQLDQNIEMKIIFISFSLAFFMYTINRFTDGNEDSINNPERVFFMFRYGKFLMFLATVLILTAAAFVVDIKGKTLLLFFLPMILGLSYSLLNFKRFYLLKNLIVAISWGSVVLLVGAYYNKFNLIVFLLFIFFTIEFFINTVIFDIKDIKGDFWNNVVTIPVKVGLQKTKTLCFVLNIFAFVMIVMLIISGLKFSIAFILLVMNIYIFAYVLLARQEYKSFFYGLFVDGEFIFGFIFYLIFRVIW